MLKFSLQNSSLSVTEKNMSKTQRTWSCWISTIDIMIHTKRKKKQKKTGCTLKLENFKNTDSKYQEIRELNITAHHTLQNSISLV